jgi:hypothetical protein
LRALTGFSPSTEFLSTGQFCPLLFNPFVDGFFLINLAVFIEQLAFGYSFISII